MTSACDALKRQVDAWRSIGHTPLLDEFVLRNGKPYFAAKYKGVRGEAKQCFKNAYDLLVVRDNLIYVEGYAIRPSLGLLIHHAWLADPKTQEVIDPTWDKPELCDYFGVPFTYKEVLVEVLKNTCYGLLMPGEIANTTLMWERDPALKAIFEERYPCHPEKRPVPPSKKSKPSSRRSTKTSKPRSSAKSLSS